MQVELEGAQVRMQAQVEGAREVQRVQEEGVVGCASVCCSCSFSKRSTAADEPAPVKMLLKVGKVGLNVSIKLREDEN